MIANTNTAANTNTVHTGSYSISATITASGGYLSFQHGGFNSAPYGNVQFWINGGTTGGQLLKVYGTLNGGTQTAYALPKLMTNVWQQFVVPLSSLGCSNKANFSGFRIQDASGGAQPVFYVDDVYLGAAPAPAVVHLRFWRPNQPDGGRPVVRSQHGDLGWELGQFRHASRADQRGDIEPALAGRIGRRHP